MATTTNYSWVTPDDTDLVKDGAAAIRTLGSSADTTTKNLNPETTLGDLSFRSSTSNVNTRLGIGSAGQFLGISAGVPAWALPAGERSVNTPKLAASYLSSANSAGSSIDTPEDTTFYVPIYLPGYAFDRISVRNGATFTGNATFRLGIYNCSPTTGLPTTVFLDAGTIVVAALSTNFEITIASTPPADYYYLAVNKQVITSGTTRLGGATNDSVTNQRISTVFPPQVFSGFTEASVTGAFATAGSLTAGSSNTTICVGLRMV